MNRQRKPYNAQERPVEKTNYMTDNSKVSSKSARKVNKRNANEYHLVPTQYPKGHGGGSWTSASSRARPRDVPGRVDISALLGTTKRKMTEGYLNTRMNRYNSVETNQNYVTKVMENPRTPEYNRKVLVEYVRNHPEKFIPVADNPDDPNYQYWADAKNGNAKRGFFHEFLKRYGGAE